MSALLRIEDLRIAYDTSEGSHEAVGGVALDVSPGEVVAVVGESGSGKSTLAHAIVGLLPSNATVRPGSSIRFGEDELVAAPARVLRRIRGRAVSLVPQDPGVSLDPVQRIGPQIAEVLIIHGGVDRKVAAAAAVEVLERAGIDQPAVRARQYPHQLSGGQRQRALIAMALVARPQLIIADEPTSALDVTVQRRILDSFDQLTREQGTAVLLITHDLGVAADRADRVLVMQRGRIVEAGTTEEVLGAPAHAYTRTLLSAAPSLASRPAPRPPVTPDRVLWAEGISKRFRIPGPRGRRVPLLAVDGVDVELNRGETLAIVGESGSGKSTTARIITRFEEPSEGRVLLGDEDITQLRRGRLRRLRKRVQLVYQNPYASLDPRWTVRQIIEEPLRAFRTGDAEARGRHVARLLDQVALPAEVSARRPGQLSGGQRQRVAIARALALEPEVIVLDEPVSALDVSVQAQILDLLAGLQRERGLGYVFVSHDLAVVRQIADRVLVMRHGSVVEAGSVQDVFERPRHPYTRELLEAIPGRRRASSPPSPEDRESRDDPVTQDIGQNREDRP
ncbi:MAG: ABC transporter ATP-binding protein [Microbacterium sp.]